MNNEENPELLQSVRARLETQARDLAAFFGPMLAAQSLVGAGIALLRGAVGDELATRFLVECAAEIANAPEVRNSMPPTAHDWIERTAAVLEELGELTSDSRFRRAAGVLRGKRIGRAPVNDTEALELARSYLDAGLVRSQTAACRRAAMFIAPANQIDTTVRRLQRKFRDESFKSRDAGRSSV